MELPCTAPFSHARGTEPQKLALYANIRVAIPPKLTKEQKALFEQLHRVVKVENKPVERDTSFFDKVKDIFS